MRRRWLSYIGFPIIRTLHRSGKEKPERERERLLMAKGRSLSITKSQTIYDDWRWSHLLLMRTLLSDRIVFAIQPEMSSWDNRCISDKRTNERSTTRIKCELSESWKDLQLNCLSLSLHLLEFRNSRWWNMNGVMIKISFILIERHNNDQVIIIIILVVEKRENHKLSF